MCLCNDLQRLAFCEICFLIDSPVGTSKVHMCVDDYDKRISKPINIITTEEAQICKQLGILIKTPESKKEEGCS